MKSKVKSDSDSMQNATKDIVKDAASNKLLAAVDRIDYVISAIKDEYPALAGMLNESLDLIHEANFDFRNTEFVKWCKR